MGYVDRGFDHVHHVFEDHFEDNRNVGASLVVYYRGRKVVDLQGGFFDQTFKQLYKNDTLSLVLSASKVIESLAIAMLVDRGQLSYEAPIAAYWPEFAQFGKEAITVGELMSHRAGLAAVDAGAGAPLMFDEYFTGPADEDELAKQHARLGELLASQKASTAATEVQMYHAHTRGLYASQIVSRVDPAGRTMGQFVHDEITVPLNIDFYLGRWVPLARRAHVAPLFGEPAWKRWTSTIPRKLLPSWLTALLYSEEGGIRLTPNPSQNVDALLRAMGDASSLTARALRSVQCRASKGDASFAGYNNIMPELFRSELPSSGGFGTASALAKVGALLANAGELHGVRLLSSEGVARANGLMLRQLDEVLMTPMQYSQGGWAINYSGIGTYGADGAGGASLQWDATRQLSLGYTMNYYGDSWRATELMAAVDRCVRHFETMYRPTQSSRPARTP